MEALSSAVSGQSPADGFASDCVKQERFKSPVSSAQHVMIAGSNSPL